MPLPPYYNALMLANGKDLTNFGRFVRLALADLERVEKQEELESA